MTNVQHSNRGPEVKKKGIRFLFYFLCSLQLCLLRSTFTSDLPQTPDPVAVSLLNLPHVSVYSKHALKLKGSNSTLHSDGINGSIPLESASACLIVSDDNHVLIEWIAYHYHVINLRHIIVISDPKSQTSPNVILDRWRDKIMIEIWNDTHIGHWNDTQIQKRQRDQLGLHRLRQKRFNVKCIRRLKSLKKSWVLLSDTDEYITINPLNPALQNPNHNGTDDHRSLSIRQPGSVMTFLQSLIVPTPSLGITTPCIPIYRRQYTALESQTNEIELQVPSNFDSSNFATLRWRKWGSDNKNFTLTTGKHCSKKRNAGLAKVIIDLARIRDQDLFHKDIEGNPHRPLESICPRNIADSKREDLGLMIHHYLGTLEQWMYRETDSRGAGYRLARYGQMKNASGVKESDTVRLWLKGFVESVGEAEASRVLKGVGKLELLPQQDKTNWTLTDPVPGEEVYKIGDLIQVRYVGKWVWAEVREAGKYYDVVALSNCAEVLGRSGNTLRRNGTFADNDVLASLIQAGEAAVKRRAEKRMNATEKTVQKLRREANKTAMKQNNTKNYDLKVTKRTISKK